MSDGRRFVAAGWPHQAAALGWTEENAVGLIWSLRGRRVIAMTARRAAIMSASGALTFYRRVTSGHAKKRLQGSWINANVSGYSPSQTLSAARSRACEGTI